MVELSHLLDLPLTQNILLYTEATSTKLVAWIVGSNRIGHTQGGREALWKGNWNGANKKRLTIPWRICSVVNKPWLRKTTLTSMEERLTRAAFSLGRSSRNQNTPSLTSLFHWEHRKTGCAASPPSCPWEPWLRPTFLNVRCVSGQEHDSQNIFLCLWLLSGLSLFQSQYFHTDSKVTVVKIQFYYIY